MRADKLALRYLNKDTSCNAFILANKLKIRLFFDSDGRLPRPGVDNLIFEDMSRWSKNKWTMESKGWAMLH